MQWHLECSLLKATSVRDFIIIIQAHSKGGGVFANISSSSTVFIAELNFRLVSLHRSCGGDL